MTVRLRYVSYGTSRQALDQMQQLHELIHRMVARTTAGTTGAWQPPTDVFERDDAIVVQAELAGVREEDIDITLFADHLTVSGTRRNTAPAEGAAYYIAGILYGEFRLNIPLLLHVDRDAVQAAYENGLLTVVLPKSSARAEPNVIRIDQSAGAASAETAPEGVTHGH
jgi:HSP20 family protein